MKRANVLRLIAVVAVVVLASMTTGCLKASMSLEVTPDPMVYSAGDQMTGKMTVIATGLLKAGVYDTLTVEFLDDASPANVKATLKVQDLKIAITPWNNASQEFDLSKYEALVVPAGAVDAAHARFILSDGGLITPISDTVAVTVNPASPPAEV